MFLLSKDNLSVIKNFCNDNSDILFYYNLFISNKIIKEKNLESFISYLVHNLNEKDVVKDKFLHKTNQSNDFVFLNKEDKNLVISILANVLFRNVSIEYLEIYMRKYNGDFIQLLNYIDFIIKNTKENIFLKSSRKLRIELVDKLKDEKLKNKIRSLVDMEDDFEYNTLQCQNCFCEEDKEYIKTCKNYHTFCISCSFMSNSEKCLNVKCNEII